MTFTSGFTKTAISRAFLEKYIGSYVGKQVHGLDRAMKTRKFRNLPAEVRQKFEGRLDGYYDRYAEALNKFEGLHGSHSPSASKLKRQIISGLVRDTRKTHTYPSHKAAPMAAEHVTKPRPPSRPAEKQRIWPYALGGAGLAAGGALAYKHLKKKPPPKIDQEPA